MKLRKGKGDLIMANCPYCGEAPTVIAPKNNMGKVVSLGIVGCTNKNCLFMPNLITKDREQFNEAKRSWNKIEF